MSINHPLTSTLTHTITNIQQLRGNLPPDLIKKLNQIKLLALDVDGVLTDGGLLFDHNGTESKRFFVQDGIGIKGVLQSGTMVALITGRSSNIVAQRAAELGIVHVIQGRDDKRDALAELAKTLNVSLDECAYCGDDLPDVGAIAAAGVGIAPQNGVWLAQQTADFITQRGGGFGAVREICEQILAAKGYLAAFYRQFL